MSRLADRRAADGVPVITPEQFLRLHGVTPTDNECTLAIVAFCALYDLKDRTGARPLEKPLLTHVDAAHQFRATIGHREILMVDRVYGGPVCATVVEELAYLGVTRVLGYGYCGSLRSEIEPGSITLATSALTTDGTSREYADCAEVTPGAGLMAALGKLDEPVRGPARPVTVWTTDAIYREYPSKVASWRREGADVVNMDTAPLYAVSRAVGIEAIYLSVVSDYVGSDEWEEDFSRIGEAMGKLHDLLLELATAVA